MRAVLNRIIAGLLLAGTASAQTVRRPQPQDVLVPDWIEAGPMIGHVGPDRAHVWVRFAKGLDFVARGTLDRSAGLQTVKPKIRKLGERVRLLVFKDLPADTPLVVQICEGAHFNRGIGLALRTAPNPASTGRVRIAFGSGCNDVLFPKTSVFAAVAQERPDLFLFVGDSTYYVREFFVASNQFDKKGRPKAPELRIDTATGDGDWENSDRMFARQLQTRLSPWLQPLLRTVPCYAVWDDHDFGTRHADRSFTGRKRSLRVFQRMWANRSYGVKGTKGCFSSFRRGPVEVFLMDGRYHRFVRSVANPGVLPPDATIWGREQFRWLCEGLRRSTAPVKLIVNGTQFLYQGKEPVGHFQLARREYEELLDYLDRQAIGGVVFLTGDRSHSELMTLRRDKRLLLEFTSSPLAGGRKIGAFAAKTQPTTEWMLRGDSFGLVTIDIPAVGKGTITCEVRDKNNRVPVIVGRRYRSSWPLSALR